MRYFLNIKYIIKYYMTSIISQYSGTTDPERHGKKLNQLENLFTFLQKYKTKQLYTHAMIYEPYGNFNIPNDKQDEFMDLYTKSVIGGYHPHITEKHKEISPIVIELNFTQDEKNRCYDNTILKNIVNTYNKLIKKYSEISTNRLHAYILEHDHPILKGKIYHDNIRIIYPRIYTLPSLQFILRIEFIELLKKNKLFNEIPHINSFEEIVNKDIIYKHNWLMYGSSKYQLTHIYNTANYKIYDSLIPGELNNKEFVEYLIKNLSIRNSIDESVMFKLKSGINPTDVDNILRKHSMINQDSPQPIIEINNLFGVELVNYSVEELKKLIKDGCTEEAKTYVKKYFIKIANPPGVMWWVPSEKRMIHHKFEDIKTLFIPKIMNGDFEIQSWFFKEETSFYLQNIDVSYDRIYESCGQKYINLFPGFMHKTYQDFDSYPESIKMKVKLIWNHIKSVWCSDQKILYKYNKCWICHMVSGRKMTTCLYLRSGQGTGKSVITDFLQLKVLGNNIVYVTSSPDLLYGFNHQLSGKVLLILEELPALNKNQWCTVSNSLKQFITGKTYTNKEKNKTDFETTNNISIIINTNNNAIKIESDDRRFVIDDISHNKVGDHDYFTTLTEATNNDKVGEAFYWYCRKYAEKYNDYKDYPPPFSESKKDLIVENLHSLFDYIKEEHVKTKKDINATFADFYSDYTEHLKSIKLESPSKIAIGKLLTNHKMGLIEGNAHVRYIKISAQKLYDIYNTKHWIHDIDDIHHLYQNI